MRCLIPSLLTLLSAATCAPTLASAQTPVPVQYVTSTGDTITGRIVLQLEASATLDSATVNRLPAPAPMVVRDTVWLPARALATFPLGPFHLPASALCGPFTATLRAVYPPALRATLDSVRACGGRVVLAVARAKMSTATKQFDLALFKAEVDRWAVAGDLRPYFADGTILGVYVVDEPNCANCWGGKTIPHALVDSTGAYVKRRWPEAVTFARVPPAWWPVTAPPRSIDAAWAQWEGRLHQPSNGMTPEQFRDKNVADAKARGLGLMFGLNVPDGGDGSSRMNGTFFTDPNLADEVYRAANGTYYRYQMSAGEVERVGSVLAAEPYACGLISWQPATFVTPLEMQAAWAKVAAVARSRPARSCARP